MGTNILAKHNLNGLEIFGYSVAGEETVVAMPILDVCFDIGKAPDKVLTINHVLLTHGHMDHAAGIAYYCSQRDFREMAPGRVLLPAGLAPRIEQLLDCWGGIDGNRPPAVIIPMVSGQEYELRRNLFARAFKTSHCEDCLGYTIIERRHKLKPEYKELTGPQIALIRKSGNEVSNSVDIPLVTYLGDTNEGDFEQLECVRQSKILIAECTFFIDEHRQRARAGRHYHFEQLAQLLPRMNNEYIILTHLSRRIDISQARQIVDKTLPAELASRIFFLMERIGRKRYEKE